MKQTPTIHEPGINPVQKLLDDLHALGFSEYEARAYVALFQNQPATAYEVSKAAGLPKANSYSVLEGLSKKEAVLPVSENPVKYIALSPDTLFNRIAKSTKQRCDRLRKELNQLSTGHQHEYVWSLNDHETISKKIEELIGAAKSHLWVKGPKELLEPYRKTLQSAADRGVSILIILFAEDAASFQLRGSCNTYLHEGNGIPAGLATQLITMTRDFEEALVADLSTVPHGSYTRNRPLVNMADTLMRHEIYFAEIFEVFGEDIQKEFGPALIELREKYLPREQADALKLLLERKSAS